MSAVDLYLGLSFVLGLIGCQKFNVEVHKIPLPQNITEQSAIVIYVIILRENNLSNRYALPLKEP